MTRLRLIVLATIGFLAGCVTSTDNAGDRYLIPVITPHGEELQEVHLATLRSATSLDGDVASIILHGSFSEQGTQLIGTTRMRLMKQGNVLVPKDATTAQGLSLYYSMEQIYQRDQQWGIAQYLSWPRRMGVDFEVFSAKKAEFETNAGYFADLNSIVVYRYHGINDSMAVDPTIISHEHFHEFFENLFMKPWMAIISKRYHITELDLSDAYEKSPGLNNLIYIFGLVQSWNEGLADFFSYAHTNEPLFGRWSIPKLSEKRNMRDDRELHSLAVFDEAYPAFEDPSGHCDRDRSCERYWHGTQLARWLYRMSLRDTSPAALAAFIVTHLTAIAEKLAQITVNTGPEQRTNVGIDYFLIELYSAYLRENTDNPEKVVFSCQKLKDALAPNNFRSNFKITGLCRDTF